MSAKVSVIGAGNVGSTLAMRIAEKGLVDVVMVDIASGAAKAKAFDISDSAFIVRHESRVYGTEDFKEIGDSSVVVLTAGFPRKPGMTREELLFKNMEVVEGVCSHIKEHAPNSVVIVVTNPLDIMTYVALKKCGFPKNRVFGMGGDLDASRFIEAISQKLGVKRSSIGTIVMGSHGDTMVPLLSQTKVMGKPLSKFLSAGDINELIKRTKERGAEIVSLLGSGSAYYAPSAAVCSLVESVLINRKRVHCVSALLEGEYGLKDICIGVPAIIGEHGIAEILKLDLTETEAQALRSSAEAIKDSLKLVHK